MKRILTAPAVIVLLLLVAFPLVMLFAQSNQTKHPTPGLPMPPGAYPQQSWIAQSGTFVQSTPMPPQSVTPQSYSDVQQRVYVPGGVSHDYPFPPKAQPEMLLEVYSLKKIKESPEKLLADGEIEELIQLYIFNSDAQDAFAINDTEQEFFAKYQKLGVKALASCKEKGNLLIVMAQARQQEQIAAFLKKLEAICGEEGEKAEVAELGANVEMENIIVRTTEGDKVFSIPKGIRRQPLPQHFDFEPAIKFHNETSVRRLVQEPPLTPQESVQIPQHIEMAEPEVE